MDNQSKKTVETLLINVSPIGGSNKYHLTAKLESTTQDINPEDKPKNLRDFDCTDFIDTLYHICEISNNYNGPVGLILSSTEKMDKIELRILITLLKLYSQQK